MLRKFFFAVLLLSSLSLHSQVRSENVSYFYQKKPKNPILAASLSAIMPGVGQIYNSQIYKVPFIYGLGALTVYYFQVNNRLYNIYYHDHVKLDNGDTNTVSKINDITLLAQKLNEANYKRQFYAALTLGVWVLNVLDAYAFAQLSNFDVSENLTIFASPVILQNQFAININITLKLNIKNNYEKIH